MTPIDISSSSSEEESYPERPPRPPSKEAFTPGTPLRRASNTTSSQPQTEPGSASPRSASPRLASPLHTNPQLGPDHDESEADFVARQILDNTAEHQLVIPSDTVESALQALYCQYITLLRESITIPAEVRRQRLMEFRKIIHPLLEAREHAYLSGPAPPQEH
ncbi:hypothetical protein PSTG_08870 [Puccinia striiformis f. sp. tritici PST-78]|uniref:Uncharacterized protein n=1 Tax=Puccinia striiformis f. sp. tritici PST-78 TaxID=1165861 RepID=A0A0L0VF06_9BASI|nr:hypothetical protein PSTG_08870 [Puccinia striiformis f. sp. tritici PST-78]